MKNIPSFLVKYRWYESNISHVRRKLAKELTEVVFKRELFAIGIDASENELQIHADLRNDDSTSQGDQKIFLRKAKAWMKRLIYSNNITEVYSKDVFSATVCLRWMLACKNRKAYIKMFLFPVKLNPKSGKYLLKMLLSRF